MFNGPFHHLRVQVEQLLGYPNSQADRQEGKLTVNTWTYQKGSRTIEAEFVNDVLIRYTSFGSASARPQTRW